MELRIDYSNVSFQNNGKLKLLIIVGTRPEIIRLAAVINKARRYFDVILAHTGQNYDYNLNGVFFKDLKLKDPEVYMNVFTTITCLHVENRDMKSLCSDDAQTTVCITQNENCIRPSSYHKLIAGINNISTSCCRH